MSIVSDTKARCIYMKKTLNDMKDNKIAIINYHEIIKILEQGFIRSRVNSSMLFYSLDEPSNMPPDARVELAYEPTYLACGIMMYIANQDNKFMNDKLFFLTLHDGLNACIGRKFMGHGYDRINGFLNAMDIFSKSCTYSFMNSFPEYNKEFNEAYMRAVIYLHNNLCKGKDIELWSGNTYKERALDIFNQIGI